MNLLVAKVWMLMATAASNVPGVVGSGRIKGGWGYVWASYAIVWAGLALYTVSLIVRSRDRKHEEQP